MVGKWGTPNLPTPLPMGCGGWWGKTVGSFRGGEISKDVATSLSFGGRGQHGWADTDRPALFSERASRDHG